jgi:hypothetical protein
VEPNIPKHWQQGALIDLKRYSDGSFKAVLAGEDISKPETEVVEFPSAREAQAWISSWYVREVRVYGST